MAQPFSFRAGRLIVVALALAAFACAGKAKQWTFNDVVEGTVTLDGAPVGNVLVQFVPNLDPTLQAPQSSAYTDEKGHYRLTCDNKRAGAVIGRHDVLVFAGRSEDPAAKRPPPIPTAYTSATRTPLHVEVTADQHTYDLKLNRSATAP
jgi:hypothetical protein